MLKIFPNTSVLPPQMPKRPAVEGRASNVRFGALSREQLASYREVLNNWGPQQYRPNNLVEVQDAFLSTQAKEQLEGIHKLIGDTKKFRSLYKKGDLEPIGYASNMLFEFYTLVALRENVIPKDFVKQFLNKNKSALAPENGHEGYLAFLNLVEGSLKTYDKKRQDPKIAHFQNLIGGDSKQAKALLNLIAAKLILQQEREPKVSLFKATKADLKSESINLNSTFPWHSLRKLKTRLTTEIYCYLSFLPVEWFRSHVLHTTQSRVGKEIRYQDLMKNLKDTQLRRLGVAYEHPGMNRKEISKGLHGMEMMNAAVVVENAKLGYFRD